MTVTESNLASPIASFDAADFVIPTGREESWRFTPLRRLRGLLDAPIRTGGVEYHSSADGSLFTVVDRQDPAIALISAPTDRTSVVAYSGFECAAVVTVPADAQLDDPIHVVVRSVGTEQSYGQVVVDIGANSRSVVVVDHTGDGAYAGDVTVRVGDGAQATVAVLQRMSDDAVLVGHVRAHLGRDARLRAVAVTLGGDVVRLATTVNYEAPGGDADLLGAFFTDTGQHQEHRLFVDHSVPNCRSNVTYKGALAGAKAHSVWIGDVLIRASATGTETYETNRNLILTDGARADSVPNLEIETGEVVGAGHAAATGRFDDEQLFYLQSRGIPAAEARRLVVRGFFADVVRRIGVDEIEAALMAAIDDELAALGRAG